MAEDAGRRQEPQMRDIPFDSRALGRALAEYYDETVTAPIPPIMRTLLARIEERKRRH